MLNHVSQAGCNPNALERARGRLSGRRWQGRVLKGSDLLPPADVHYLWHVVDQQGWPDGTDQLGYFDSIRQVIEDSTSGIFTNRYQGVPGLAIIRESRSHDWDNEMGGLHLLTRWVAQGDLDEADMCRYHSILGQLNDAMPALKRLNLQLPEFPHET